MSVRFTKSKKDMEMIRKIVERAKCMDVFSGTSLLGIEMDISACHANGNPLDLKKLLDADNFNFVHDVCGICYHMNRQTGKLDDRFLPRCSMPQKRMTA